MKLDHLSDKELIQYVDKHTEDPLARRLVDILMGRNEGIITELTEAGMDSVHWTFVYEHQEYSPKDYIEHLLKQISYTEDDLWVAQGELKDRIDDLKKLEARTVLEFMADLKKSIEHADAERDRARQERDHARNSEQNMKSKMKVWRALTEDTTR
jgi:hypothetical protein